MKTIDLYNRIMMITCTIAEREKDRVALLQQFADAVCPFKVGDRPIVPQNAYSHNGKQCEVFSVAAHVQSWDSKIRITIRAKVLRKDGTPSERIAEWYQYVDGRHLP